MNSKNLYFDDKYDVRNYLDKVLGYDISNDIFDVFEKEERKVEKEKKQLADYCKYAEQMEECAGNLDTCIDKIEISIRNISSILLSASIDKKISKKLYKEVMGEMDAIKEYINDVDEDRH